MAREQDYDGDVRIAVNYDPEHDVLYLIRGRTAWVLEGEEISRLTHELNSVQQTGPRKACRQKYFYRGQVEQCRRFAGHPGSHGVPDSVLTEPEPGPRQGE